MKIAIIGGGIGGMVSALLLQKNGYEVSIYEQKEKLGGRLTHVQQDGYTIDEGPTIVLLPDILKEMLESCGISSDELPLYRCDPMYQMVFSDGSTYTKHASMSKQLAYMEEAYPGEGENLERFLHDMKNTFQVGVPMFLDRDFIKKRDFLTANNVYTLWKLKAYENTRKLAKRYFAHPNLQEAYSFQTLYIGGNPFTTPAIYNLIAFSEHEHGIWYLQGGYHSLVPLLEKKLKQAGVTIHYQTKVTSLEVKEQQVVGLHTPHTYIPYDMIVTNGDYPVSEKLLPSPFQKKQFEASSGCYLLYIGLKHLYKDIPVHRFVMSQDTKQHMDEVFKDKKIPTSPSIYTFNPSLIDDTLAPANHSVLYALVPVPSGVDLDWETEPFKEQILTRLENSGFTNLKKQIEWIQIRTPQQAEQDGLFQGGSFGLAPTLLQSAAFRPQIKPTSLENFYAVGASVHPGGGIPIVLKGAKLLVDTIIQDSRSQKRRGQIERNKGSLSQM